MNYLDVIGYVLAAVGAASSPIAPPRSSTTSDCVVDIVIAGPEAARGQILAQVRPLLAPIPNVCWREMDSVPEVTAAGIGVSGPPRLVIDLSDITDVRLSLRPTGDGGMTLRTVANPTLGPGRLDDVAAETVAQIVKASVLTLSEGRAHPEEASRVSPVEDPIVRQPHQIPTRRRLYLTLEAGVSYLRSADSAPNMPTHIFDGVGPHLGATLGGPITDYLSLYAKCLMTWVINANERYDDFLVTPQTGRDLYLFSTGPGISYRLPFNLHVSATFLVSKMWFLNANTDNPPPDTNWGVGGDVTLRADWQPCPRCWVGRAGLGLQVSRETMTHHISVSEMSGTHDVAASMDITAFSMVVTVSSN